MPTYERLDYGSPDGSQWGGSSTDRCAMFGLTPVVQPSYVPAVSTHTAYSQSSASATTFGFRSADAFTSFIHQVSTINAAGRSLGLWT